MICRSDMVITDREFAKLMSLKAEIDKETRGKCRRFVIDNRTRQMSLILNKARRREKELETKRKTEGLQLTLF